MSLPETISFDKEGKVVRFPLLHKLFLPLVVILVALLGFGIGKLTTTASREAVKIENDTSMSTQESPAKTQTAAAVNSIVAPVPQSSTSQSGVIASKNGTKYYYPNCSGVKRIKEENKVTFPSAKMAEEAGLTLAANCGPK